MGLVAAVAVVMLIVGFLLGTRGRQIVQIASKLAQAVRSLTIRIPPQVSVDLGKTTASSSKAKAAAAAAASASGAETAVEDEGLAAKADVIDGFMSFSPSALDDHPEVQTNPVLLYQIRIEKEQLRIAKRREALLAQLHALGEDVTAFSDDELGQRLAEQELAGGLASTQTATRSSFNVLLSAGARFTAVGSATTAAAAVAERRRLARNIETYIGRTLGLAPGGTRKVEAAAPRHKGPEGQRLKSAYEVAKETEYLPHVVHGPQVRAQRSLTNAKESREALREWEKGRRLQRVRDGLPDVAYCSDSDGEPDDKGPKATRREAVGGEKPTAAQLASLQDLMLEEHGDLDGGVERNDDDTLAA